MGFAKLGLKSPCYVVDFRDAKALKMQKGRMSIVPILPNQIPDPHDGPLDEPDYMKMQLCHAESPSGFVE
jgi:hypothetical protein